MPDLPPSKRRPIPAGTARPGSEARAPRYAELHCRTNFSFLEGASHPDELVQRAVELGYHALAITDRNSLAGVVRAHIVAKELGLKLLIGAEITPVDAPPVILLATDRAAYGRLSRLITVGRRRAEKGECELMFEDIAEHAEGLLACVLVGQLNNEPEGNIANCKLKIANCKLGSDPQLSTLNSQLLSYRDLFGDRCYALAELHHGPEDVLLLQRMIRAARKARMPLVAANDVAYHSAEKRPLQDVLTAIRHGCTVAELGERRFSNAERYPKSPQQMTELFAACPEAISRTVEIAGRCRFSLDELRYEYPEELAPPGMTPIEHLSRLTWEGAGRRYPHGPPDKVRQLIEYELKLIEELRYEAYFLTVWDLVRFARGRGILCQGRGSAANSAVCYCLEVTSVDPERIDVLFERFVSKERDEAPDIDIDFEHERREEVIQYVYDKYGRDRAGMTAEVITYRPKSAVRDIGKALGLSLDRVDALAKTLDQYGETGKITDRFREAGMDPAAPVSRQLITLVRQVLGFPRHLSQHVGGMVMTQRSLCEYVPIENASMPGRTVIQWDKDDLDALGILKVDCLALGMLTAIHRAFDLLERHYPEDVRCQLSVVRGRRSGIRSRESGVRNQNATDNGLRTTHHLTLADIPPEDPAVYEMIQGADTMGVFQIESRAQMAMLPRLRPERFYDLVIEVAIVRPGPIQGDMVHPYLRRRCKEEKVEYPDDRIKVVLEKTLGVPIFQEQAMRLAVVAAGFTPGEADQLRRAMGAWRKRGLIEQFRQKLIDGMQRNGYTAEFGERLYQQISGFGEYGFPESHAASFALLVYVSAWIKCHYPDVFAAALINSQPMGFYAPAQLVADARKQGVEVRPVDVNASEWDCTLEGPVVRGPWSVAGEQRSEVRGQESGVSSQRTTDHGHRTALRLGFRVIRGLAKAHAETIVACRNEGGPFTSFDEFAHRTGLSSAVLSKLSRADAFSSLQMNRRRSLWNSLPIQKQLPLFETAPSSTTDHGQRTTDLPPMSPLSEVVADYQHTGLSLKDHPVKFLRPMLRQMQVVYARELAYLPVDRRVKVAGLVLLRQRPGTASGITFVTLEDETGFANLIIHPGTWERFHHAARTASVLLVRGILQREKQVIHVLVDKLEDLSAHLKDAKLHSRDFR